MNQTSPAKRHSTGVPGLDGVLHGGLPAEAMYLLQGDPGVGKTTLSLQFLLAGVRAGHSCLYITLAETRREVERVARSHRWSLDGITLFELSKLEHQNEPDAQSTIFHPSEMELVQTARILIEEMERVQPVLVVFDSLSELRLLAQSSLRYRRQLLALKQYFARSRCTALLLDDKTSEVGDLQVQSIAHGVIAMERMHTPYGADRRRLNVVKLRGATFHGGFHDYAIETGGLRVFPRLTVPPQSRRSTAFGQASSGNDALDLLLGGGLDRGTSTLLMGPAGSGKSSLATFFALTATTRGERVAYFMFDESASTFASRSMSLGKDVAAAEERGLLVPTQIDPAEMSPGEFAHRVKTAVDDGARAIIIDSLNGYMQAMPAENYLVLQLHELLSYLGQRGVLTILTAAQQGLLGQMRTQFDLTYLADAVVLFRFFEYAGEVRQALSVIKKRCGDHERTIREFKLSGSGVQIGERLTSFQGILTGTPVFAGSANQIIAEP